MIAKTKYSCARTDVGKMARMASMAWGWSLMARMVRMDLARPSQTIRAIAVHHGNSQIPGDTLHLASETVLGNTTTANWLKISMSTFGYKFVLVVWEGAPAVVVRWFYTIVLMVSFRIGTLDIDMKYPKQTMWTMEPGPVSRQPTSSIDRISSLQVFLRAILEIGFARFSDKEPLYWQTAQEI